MEHGHSRLNAGTCLRINCCGVFCVVWLPSLRLLWRRSRVRKVGVTFSRTKRWGCRSANTQRSSCKKFAPLATSVLVTTSSPNHTASRRRTRTYPRVHTRFRWTSSRLIPAPHCNGEWLLCRPHVCILRVLVLLYHDMQVMYPNSVFDIAGTTKSRSCKWMHGNKTCFNKKISADSAQTNNYVVKQLCGQKLNGWNEE